MRVTAVLPVLCLTLAPLPVLLAQSAPVSAAGGSRLYYYATPRSTLATEAHNVPADDQERLNQLKNLFAQHGCSGDQLRIRPLEDKHGGPPNLICTWPGISASTVVVLAEYQHMGKGQSAVENWSGAVLLPCLYFAMQARPRDNSWVFVESGSKAGAAAYVRTLSAAQKKQIRAMVVISSLGLSPVTRFYSPAPENTYLPAAVAHLQMTFALATLSDSRVPRPEDLYPFGWLPSDDTQPFRYSQVPCILLDSVSGKEASLPGSVRDTASAIDGNAYFMNYRAIAVFLTGLDSVAAKLRNDDDPIWHGEGSPFHFDANDLPSIH